MRKILLLAVMFAASHAGAREFAADMPVVHVVPSWGTVGFGAGQSLDVKEFLAEARANKDAPRMILAGKPALAVEAAVDARMVKEVFGVSLEPDARLHGRLVGLDSVGDFELRGGQCIVAVSQGKPTESVEVIHKEAIFDTKAYSVTQHTFVLIRDSSRLSHLVMDVVVRASQTTRDPIFGAFSEARQAHLVYRARLSEALGMSARCPASMASVTKM
ncbi:MAG: hypothetical protein HZB91_15185 [Elusimicrobia bacterium]|nr:hypothetical protein [Elusimicrobiota bacterium]